MRKITISLKPCETPKDVLIVAMYDRFEEAPLRLFRAMDSRYGPFQQETDEGTKWCEIYGDVLLHLGQAFTLLGEGDNPAVVVRSVPGDEESNYELTVAIE